MSFFGGDEFSSCLPIVVDPADDEFLKNVWSTDVQEEDLAGQISRSIEEEGGLPFVSDWSLSCTSYVQTHGKRAGNLAWAFDRNFPMPDEIPDLTIDPVEWLKSDVEELKAQLSAPPFGPSERTDFTVFHDLEDSAMLSNPLRRALIADGKLEDRPVVHYLTKNSLKRFILEGMMGNFGPPFEFDEKTSELTVNGLIACRSPTPEAVTDALLKISSFGVTFFELRRSINCVYDRLSGRAPSSCPDRMLGKMVHFTETVIQTYAWSVNSVLGRMLDNFIVEFEEGPETIAEEDSFKAVVWRLGATMQSCDEFGRRLRGLRLWFEKLVGFSESFHWQPQFLDLLEFVASFATRPHSHPDNQLAVGLTKTAGDEVMRCVNEWLTNGFVDVPRDLKRLWEREHASGNPFSARTLELEDLRMIEDFKESMCLEEGIFYCADAITLLKRGGADLNVLCGPSRPEVKLCLTDEDFELLRDKLKLYEEEVCRAVVTGPEKLLEKREIEAAQLLEAVREYKEQHIAVTKHFRETQKRERERKAEARNARFEAAQAAIREREEELARRKEERKQEDLRIAREHEAIEARRRLREEALARAIEEKYRVLGKEAEEREKEAIWRTRRVELKGKLGEKMRNEAADDAEVAAKLEEERMAFDLPESLPISEKVADFEGTMEIPEHLRRSAPTLVIPETPSQKNEEAIRALKEEISGSGRKVTPRMGSLAARLTPRLSEIRRANEARVMATNLGNLIAYEAEEVDSAPPQRRSTKRRSSLPGREEIDNLVQKMDAHEKLISLSAEKRANMAKMASTYIGEPMAEEDTTDASRKEKEDLVLKTPGKLTGENLEAERNRLQAARAQRNANRAKMMETELGYMFTTDTPEEKTKIKDNQKKVSICADVSSPKASTLDLERERNRRKVMASEFDLPPITRQFAFDENRQPRADEVRQPGDGAPAGEEDRKQSSVPAMTSKGTSERQANRSKVRASDLGDLLAGTEFADDGMKKKADDSTERAKNRAKVMTTDLGEMLAIPSKPEPIPAAIVDENQTPVVTPSVESSPDFSEKLMSDSVDGCGTDSDFCEDLPSNELLVQRMKADRSILAAYGMDSDDGYVEEDDLRQFKDFFPQSSCGFVQGGPEVVIQSLKKKLDLGEVYDEACKIPREHDARFLPSLIPQTIAAHLHTHLALIDRIFLSWALDKDCVDLLGRFRSMWQVFFLYDSDISQFLVKQLCDPAYLAKWFSSRGGSTDCEAVSDVFSTSICSGAVFQEALSLSGFSYENNEDVRNFKLAVLKPPVKLDDCKMLPGIIVDYDPPWPMNGLLSKSVMEIYNGMFTLLLRLRILCAKLSKMYCDMKHHFGGGNAMSRLEALDLTTCYQFRLLMVRRLSMSHFVFAMMQFFQTERATTSIQLFERRLEKEAASWRHVQMLHYEFIMDLRAHCLLDDSSRKSRTIMNLVHRAMDAIVSFCDIYSAGTWIRGEDNYKHSSFLQLTDHFTEFNLTSSLLYRVANSMEKAAPKAAKASIAALLDFNGFYQRQIAAKDEWIMKNSTRVLDEGDDL